MPVVDCAHCAVRGDSCNHELPSECARFKPSLPTIGSIIGSINALEAQEIELVRHRCLDMRNSTHKVYEHLHTRTEAIRHLDEGCAAEFELTGDCKILGEIATALDVTDIEWPSEVEPVGK